MKKGFTLIELLAVIVILAIIALIASPIIIGLIDDARKEAFKDSGYGIIKAGEIYYSKNMLNGTRQAVTFTYAEGVETPSIEGEKLDYNGTKPKSGQVKVKKDGKIAVALHNGKYCTEKGYEDSEVTLSDKTEDDCRLPFECGDVFVDSRDTNKYKTVQIGTQCWMADDLRYDCLKAGKGYTANSCGNQGTGYTGLLYDWPVAMSGSTSQGAQGLCPSGWHIPSNAEWTTLISFVGDNAGTKLKATASIWNGTNNFGFNVKPAGYRYIGVIYYPGSYSMFWTSSDYPSATFPSSWARVFNTDENGVIQKDYQVSDVGASVRCVFNPE